MVRQLGNIFVLIFSCSAVMDLTEKYLSLKISFKYMWKLAGSDYFFIPYISDDCVLVERFVVSQKRVLYYGK